MEVRFDNCSGLSSFDILHTTEVLGFLHDSVKAIAQSERDAVDVR